MALIKRADAQTQMSRAVTLDLGDIGRRGQMLREAAVAEAERIVREAHAERARILEGAAEEGRERGHAEGLEAGRAEGRAQGREEAVAEWRERLAAFDASWGEQMAGFIRDRETLLLAARAEVVRLAAAIAERVVHRAVELDPSVVGDQMRELLSMVTGPTTLTVRVHPDDEPLVGEVLPRLREQFVEGIQVRLQPDGAVSRGSCVAKTTGGASIDASLETQLARVVRDLLPGPGAEA